MGIRRAKRDRWIAGVCGGIAHTYGYKPWVVRLSSCSWRFSFPV